MGEGPETEGATGREGEDRLQSRRPRAHPRLPLCSQFTTTVVSCSPAELQTDASGGKKEVLSGFQVVLEDTLLFPEGGGQVYQEQPQPDPLPGTSTFLFAPAENAVALP